MKLCTRCIESKKLEDFACDRQKKDGLRNWCRACVREHRQINADQVKASKARYVSENREAILRKGKEYHEAKRDEILARKRKYDAENKARTAARTAAYYVEHPEKKWINTYQNRARAYGFSPIVENFTKQDVIDTYGRSCHYCPDGEFEELDHHVAIAARGIHSLSNVRPCCPKCNNQKSVADKTAARNARIHHGA